MWQYSSVPSTHSIILETLTAGFPGAQVEVRDTTGGDDHFDVRVVSSAFAGKLPVQRHQLVYAALGELMRTRIHALSLKTETPESNQP
jgi:stress-induced morphogen